MKKCNTTHSLQVFVHCWEEPIEVTEEKAALTVLEQFKQQMTLKIPVAGDSDSTCYMYVPYQAVVAVLDCPTTECETVEDDICTEYTDPCGPGKEDAGEP